MNDPTGQTAFTAKRLTAQDKIIAVQRECEEVCLQSDTPDYRALYLGCFRKRRSCACYLIHCHRHKKPSPIAQGRLFGILVWLF